MISNDHVIQVELAVSNYTIVEAIKKINGIKEVVLDHHVLTIISQYKNVERNYYHDKNRWWVY